MDYVHPRFSALGRNEYAQRRNEAVSVIYDADQKECPYCHSRSIIRNGHVKSNHRSRYYCKDCHHSFVSSIHTVYYRGRLGQHEVRSLLDSLVVDTTVIGAAKETSVSKNTSLRYRHMLLEYVEKADKKPVLSGEGVQVDETYKTLSGMVGHEKKKKGISSQKEAICVGTDYSGRIFLKDLKNGHPTMQSLKNTWTGYIADGSVITHDMLHGYSGAFDFLADKKEITVRSTEPEEEKALEHLNHLCAGVQWFLRKHRGIVKKRLNQYLSWYEILYNENPTLEEFENLVFSQYLKNTDNNT